VNRRLLPTLLIALGLVVAGPVATSAAKINVAVGIGDQSPKMFADPSWKALNIKKTRYFIEWNAIDQPAEIADADKFVSEAKAAGVKVFMHISTDDINSIPVRPLPSTSNYKKKVKALVTRYKSAGVTEWGVWNEANHKSQPTSKNPKRAADFYKAFKAMCKNCKIVALDVLDQAGVERYIARWLKAAGSAGRSAKIFGIHNYSQVNRRITAKKASNRYPGTARIIKAVRKQNKKAKFWYTETGGLASFGGDFECDRKRQANRTKFMFDMIKAYDRDVERLYAYNWFGTDNGGCDGFDAGLVEADGDLRPAYASFKKGLKSATR
jgi:Glycosyl hydrolase catalytic core